MPDLPHRLDGVNTAQANLPEPPLVSIIMSMRDSAATVATAIRSIQLQTLENWELFIDDGSVDQSVAIVGAINDPRIHLVKEPYSAGLATRLNQAVAMTRGEFIARMDADDVSFPDRLTLQINNLKRNSSIDVLGCGAVVFADNITLIGTLPIERTHERIGQIRFPDFRFHIRHGVGEPSGSEPTPMTKR